VCGRAGARAGAQGRARRAVEPLLEGALRLALQRPSAAARNAGALGGGGAGGHVPGRGGVRRLCEAGKGKGPFGCAVACAVACAKDGVAGAAGPGRRAPGVAQEHTAAESVAKTAVCGGGRPRVAGHGVEPSSTCVHGCRRAGR
jgi:hypothetical protein